MSQWQMYKGSKESGFTLIELMAMSVNFVVILSVAVKMNTTSSTHVERWAIPADITELNVKRNLVLGQ